MDYSGWGYGIIARVPLIPNQAEITSDYYRGLKNKNPGGWLVHSHQDSEL
jgi:hypothetical protein